MSSERGLRAAGSSRRLEVLTGAALFLLSGGWVFWQNRRVAVLWDLAYLLDSAWRFSLGQLPYRDLPFAHAPLTFLLHAAIIKLFGRVYWPHIACAAVESGCATVLTWRILLRLWHPREPAFRHATVLAAPLVVLGIYAVYPHPIYDSDAVLAVLLSLCLLQRAEESGAAAVSVCAGAACVLPLFFKQNIGLAFLAGVAVYLVFAGTSSLRSRRRIGFAAWALAGIT